MPGLGRARRKTRPSLDGHSVGSLLSWSNWHHETGWCFGVTPAGEGKCRATRATPLNWPSLDLHKPLATASLANARAAKHDSHTAHDSGTLCPRDGQ
jgi:hypothetical protein